MATTEEMIWKVDQFYGIDNSVDDTNLPAGNAATAANFDTTQGNLKVCGGYSNGFENGISGQEIRKLMPFYQKNTGGKLLVLAWNPTSQEAHVYYNTNTASGTWTQLNDPGVSIGNQIFSYINYQREEDDIILFADGAWLKYWNGTTNDIAKINVPYAPLGIKYVALGNERVWGAGIGNEPDRVYYSKPYQPTDWYDDESDPDQNGGYIDLPTWDKGGRIIGLCEAFGDMIVFKENDIFRIFGEYPSQFSTDRLSGIEGPISHNAIVKYDNIVYYLGKNGIYLYDGARVSRLSASDKMRDAWEWLTFEKESTARMTVFEGKLYLSLPTMEIETVDNVTTSNIVPNSLFLVYDLKRNTFMKREGLTAKEFATYRFEGDGNKKEWLLFANHSSMVYKLDDDALNNGEEPVKAYWETPWMDFKRKDVTKRVTATYAVGAGSAGAQLVLEAMNEKRKKEKVIPVPQADKTMRTRIRIRGRRIKFRLANYRDAAGTPGESGYIPKIEAKPLELKSGVQFTIELDED